MKKSLSGTWRFRQADSSIWKNATVPGCNFCDLLALGEIPDPFISLGEKEVQWVAQKDWEYKKSFTLSKEELEADEIRLNFLMLDTVCSVFVNDIQVGKADNCFKAHSFSIKEQLKEGENEVRVLFYSPVKYVEKIFQKEGAPNNSNGQNGIVHIRKPQSHFGWDWGPVLPLSGICKDAELEFITAGKIEYLAVSQKHENGKVKISVDIQTKSFSNYECKIILTEPNGKTSFTSGTQACFEIEEPELWWTYELSGKDAQPLYEITAQLEKDGKIFETQSKKIGLRTIELNREKDKYGLNFQFRLNGVALFIKGANYIPPDSFMTRFDREKLKQLIAAARFSNMNMIRVWGGGYYESDDFYNLCDEMGILVWQDFQFACQAYPFFKKDFLSNVKSEVEYNVKRLCHHASLAVWCGNNEIEDMHMGWVHMSDYVSWTEKFFYHILEPEIRKYDLSTPYTPGSPIGISHNKGVESDNVGDTHLWGVWHGLKPMNYYRKRMTRFCSEFGFESLPNMQTINRFAKDKNHSLSSDEFKAHQKCANGNDKMIYYIASRFNLPKNFCDYVYLSQLAQSECISDAVEHWRRNKGQCNGAMYWQFNDCWPVCSWSSLDYYGGYKALQYCAKNFNAPLSVSIENTEDYIDIYLLNDLNKVTQVKIECDIFDFENGVLKHEVKELTADSLSTKKVFHFEIQKLRFRYNLKRTALAVRLISSGKELMQKTVMFEKEKNLLLPKAKLDYSIKNKNDELEIEVKSDKFVRLVQIETGKSFLPLSDNFFDLLPGQTKTVTVKKDPALSLEEQKEQIKISSLCDVEPDKNKLKGMYKKLKVFLSPVNLSNAAYHGRLSKNVKID